MTHDELAAERAASKERQDRRLRAGERPLPGRKTGSQYREFNVGGWRREEDDVAHTYLAPRSEG